VPFHYFGVHDDVDLRGIEWKRGTYDTAALLRLDGVPGATSHALDDSASRSEQWRSTPAML